MLIAKGDAMERTRSAQARTEGDSADRPRDPARLEELIEALLASVRGGDGIDPTLPGPVSCGCSGACLHEPCETPPKESLQPDLSAPLCAVTNRR
jgi:hypothetical protein